MLQENLKIRFNRLKNFLDFARAYIIKNNPLKIMLQQLAKTTKDFLTVTKKIKMARYRLNYQRYRFQQMEQLIAQNNEHLFLKGKKVNEVR